VPLTHKNLAASLANIVATYELRPADRSLLVMPLFHVHGLMAGAARPLPPTGSDAPRLQPGSPSYCWACRLCLHAAMSAGLEGMHPACWCRLDDLLRAGFLAPLLAGAAVIMPAGGRFSAKSFWRDACDFGATFYTAVPTMHQVGACLGMHASFPSIV
jgi:acyl-CoA synthetase (AMP-forming)/AMP-acid ligase II